MLMKINKKFILLLVVCFTTYLILFPFSQSVSGYGTNNILDEISNLDKSIDAKKKEIEELQKRIETYKKNIELSKQKSISLENEIAILDNQIAKLKLDIEASEKKIEQIGLEIESLELKIEENNQKIEKQKIRLAELIRLIYKNDQVNYLKILIVNKSFSEFFDQLQYLKELQTELQNALNQIKRLKAELETKKIERENKKQEEEKYKAELEEEKNSLEEKMIARGVLLEETKASEKQFQNLLLLARLEQEQINSEIVNLEKRIREKLAESDKAFFEGKPGDVVLSWPVDPSRGITAYFHDPDYPYRYIFEHPAIDIRAPQGTPVLAAAPGYVARAKDGGMGYSYVMIIHNGGISTVYGHLSKILVQEDTYVIRGQTIGLSGGMPGTPGAGRLTTGPHLHFEVRLNGIPVNPLEYLP
jgi:murein DD-endopeptidase MepM/ murein hydrolase activator NlpD